MVAPLIGELIELWVIATVLCFALVFFGAASSIKDRETMVIGCWLPVVIVGAAFVITLLQLFGIIGIW